MTKKKLEEIKESRHGFYELANSRQFKEYRDLLEALLDKEKEYTQEEVNKVIEKYMKGKVE